MNQIYSLGGGHILALFSTPMVLFIPTRIVFEIFDGKQWSHPATVTVTVRPLNDNAPQLNVTGRGSPFIEGSREGVLLLSDAVLTDLDHPERFNYTGASVSDLVYVPVNRERARLFAWAM